MCNVYKKIGAVFCTFGVILMFMAGLMLNVSAADDNSGTLTLTCESDDFGLADMQWKIYKVGENKGGIFALTGDFANYHVDLSKIMEDSDSMTEAASTLSNYAVLDEIIPVQNAKTNGRGVVQFKGLNPGLYLAIGNKIKVGTVSYFPTPLLFELGGSSTMNVSAYPKFITKYTLPDTKDRFIMRKIWANASMVTDKPVSLDVEIYEDGELFDTIQLTDDNGWTYSWEGAAASEWRVKEVNVPAGCYVMYRNNEVQFVIMNSYDGELLALTTTTTATTTTTVTTTTTGLVAPITETRDITTTTTAKPFDGDDGSRVRTTTTTYDVVTTTTVKPSEGDEGSRVRDTSTTPTGVLPVTSSGDNDTTTTVSGETSSTNTKTTEKDDSGNNSTKSSRTTVTTTSLEKLPQTGQLWWPVPVMLVGGLMFVAVGLRLLLNNRKED